MTAAKHWFASFLADFFLRKVVILLATVIPGLLLNFGLIIIAARLLSIEIFGVFYFGLSLAAMLASPAAVVAFFLARRLGAVRSDFGDARFYAHVRHSFPKYVALIAGLGAIFCAVLWIASIITGAGSVPLVLAVALAAISGYLIEIVRGIFKSLGQFFQLGLFGLGWMLGRFVFGVVALIAFGKAWFSLLAVGASGLVATCAYTAHLYSKRRVPLPEGVRPEPVRWNTLVTFSFSYGIVFAIAYIDIVAAYFTLDDVAFGAYSTSAVIPKGLYTLTMPIMQVMFPLVIEEDRSDALNRTFLKSIWLTIAVCLVVFSVVLVTAQPLCTVLFVGKNCSGNVMIMLTLAILGASVLRGIVLYQLAKRQDMMAFSIAIPLFSFPLFQMLCSADAEALARNYLIFVGLVMIGYAVFSFLRNMTPNKTR